MKLNPYFLHEDLGLLERGEVAASGAELACSSADYLGTSRDQRDLVAIGKPARQSSAQAFPDSDHNTDFIGGDCLNAAHLLSLDYQVAID